MDIHEKIAVLMRRQGLTQKALAEMIGVSQNAVHGWCTTSKPRPDAMERLSKVLNINSDYLVTEMDLPEWIPPLRIPTENGSVLSADQLKKISQHCSTAATALNAVAGILSSAAKNGENEPKT